MQKPADILPDESDDGPVSPETVLDCLKYNRLRLYYQPIVDIASRKPVMYEIYLRLIDREKREIAPGRFIPTVIQHNLSEKIDRAVIQTAIKQNLSRLTGGQARLSFNINLLGKTLDSIHFLEDLIHSITNQGVTPARLQFEIRSREILEDPQGLDFIHACQEIGCRFVVDYIGGGARAVEATRRMKFDYLKLDGLRLAPDDQPDEAKINELISKAHELNLPVIMEKIEGPKLLKLCMEKKIPYVQGYFVARPTDKLNG